jgi:hypothetical protein
MDGNLEYFEKFIVKQIVNTVNYDLETDEYRINRIHISDDVIRVIEEEGIRYGLDKRHVGQIITNISENIKTTPSSKLRYDSIDVGKLEIGSHIRINIMHPNKGQRYLEMIVLDKYRFYVLSSDIGGILFGDQLHALDGTWNNGCLIDFLLYRNSKRKPNEDKILRVGKISVVEMFIPPIVNEILDSNSTYSYDTITTIEKKDTITFKEKKIKKESKQRSYYFWIPNKWKPISFCWKEGDAQNENSAFIITDSEDSKEAKIVINKDFVLSNEGEHLNQFMDILFDCCKWKNEFNGIENLKYIRNIKAGVVKRIISEDHEKEWELVSQPKIKFVYE